MVETVRRVERSSRSEAAVRLLLVRESQRRRYPHGPGSQPRDVREDLENVEPVFHMGFCKSYFERSAFIKAVIDERQ